MADAARACLRDPIPGPRFRAHHLPCRRRVRQDPHRAGRRRRGGARG
nr:MAG TPA: hypothetical protein [Caudoviricetes sp.]DAX82395.1 MAG TPA: hypothetical protein [Caudoviricetes sp.]